MSRRRKVTKAVWKCEVCARTARRKWVLQKLPCTPVSFFITNHPCLNSRERFSLVFSVRDQALDADKC
jgi:hypothetical protein